MAWYLWAYLLSNWKCRITEVLLPRIDWMLDSSWMACALRTIWSGSEGRVKFFTANGVRVALSRNSRTVPYAPFPRTMSPLARSNGDSWATSHTMMAGGGGAGLAPVAAPTTGLGVCPRFWRCPPNVGLRISMFEQKRKKIVKCDVFSPKLVQYQRHCVIMFPVSEMWYAWPRMLSVFLIWCKHEALKIRNWSIIVEAAQCTLIETLNLILIIHEPPFKNTKSALYMHMLYKIQLNSIISLIPRLSHRLSYSTIRTISWSWYSSTNYFMARALSVRSES